MPTRLGIHSLYTVHAVLISEHTMYAVNHVVDTISINSIWYDTVVNKRSQIKIGSKNNISRLNYVKVVNYKRILPVSHFFKYAEFIQNAAAFIQNAEVWNGNRFWLWQAGSTNREN